MTRSLKVSYVLGTTSGGTGRHVAMLAQACAAAGVQVGVFGPSSTQSMFAPGLAFTPVPIADRPRPVSDLTAVLRLRQGFAAARPDIVHAHGLRAGAIAALASWPGRARVGSSLMVTVHNAPPVGGRLAAIYALLERIVARRADLVLCVSPDLADRMRRLGARDVRRALVPAPLAGSALLARPQSSAGPSPAQLAQAGRPIVLAVGRLAAQKGFAALLTAAASWQHRQPTPLLVIAGAGPLAGALAVQAAELGVEVEFLGQRTDVAELLAVAAVFVLPSQWEGQPLIVQEALRAGCPIVATDVGGVRALTGDAALLVPPGDPAELGRAVLSVLDDPEFAARLAKAGATRAADLPTEADAVGAALACYRQLR